ncbi:MAG: DUF1775 domain-containing protein [Actinobacteria bacterium]|uniref:Unannotated protein n=1 Tax=freshwater metagenome TaxID=449393 RepID=A0A6J6NB74_9ZZZZ|nr:DUF1775 domain-containing protein [Actinomycetota bacterium]
MLRKSRVRLLVFGAAAVAALAVGIPLASGHATLTLLFPVPGTQPLTAATDTWLLRVPNERYHRSTWKVVLHIPAVAQSSFTLRQHPGWKTTLTTQDTGAKDGNGDPVSVVTDVTWQALPGNNIGPGTAWYGEFQFRFKNPATPGPVCFHVDQYYNGQTKGAPVEVVSWADGAGTAHPAPCVNVVSS